MPDPFFAAGSTTSEAAAAQLQTRASDAIRILRLAEARGEDGITCDDVKATLGLDHSNASARVHELGEQSGALERAGFRRRTRTNRTAEVYKLPANMNALEAWQRHAAWCATPGNTRTARRRPADRAVLDRAREWHAMGCPTSGSGFNALHAAVVAAYGGELADAPVDPNDPFLEG
jgi:hypothetical protein